ncbi:MAG: hypothetical protein XD98_0314 [Microgenomates bacterium 39_6]|nr:MAG: hypothetical protein XD98_0314 [Microgenomates bacterium 39_6]
MIRLIKRWLFLVGLVYLSSLAVGNVGFDKNFTTIAVLALLIMFVQWLFGPLEKTLLQPLNKISFGLAGPIAYILAICFISFSFNQINFHTFTNQNLPEWLNNFAPQVYLAGFWSLLPFSAIIGMIDWLLIKSKK